MTDQVQAALERMGEEDYERLKKDLRRRERRARRSARVSQRTFDREDPGYPLGFEGRTLRLDGESHREAWMRVLRGDPCAFCGRQMFSIPCPYFEGGTVDHIEPRSRSVSGLGGAHTWLNYTAACGPCNSRKSDRPMLLWMLSRRGVQTGLPRHMAEASSKSKPKPPKPKEKKPQVAEVPSSDKAWIKAQFARQAAA